MTFLTNFKILTSTALLALGMTCSMVASAQSVSLAQAPMLTLKTAPGLVMLTMGRDLPLYRAAYNDVNDIDGDGVPDIYFKPAFKYEGYFAYDRCYTYASSVFTPNSIGTAVVVDATDTSKNYYKCPGKWSGNFLNWVTMARIDVLRKVLYGGKRSTDTASTVLERTYVPQDSTLWGKEYASLARDGYNITDFTPLAQPTGTVGVNKHMFANVTLQGSDAIFATTVGLPRMIVYENQSGRIWDLVAAEQLILGTNPSGTGITQYVVRVTTCVPISGKYEDWCTPYVNGATTTYKPTGLLHKYGEAKTLAFGLISGTYDNNYAGGVLRQNIDDFNQEVDATNGSFKTTVNGVVHHLDAFRPWGFGNNTWGGEDYTLWNFSSVPGNGDNPMWGNPLGEIMFESLKYFSGGAASTAYTANVGVNTPVKAGPPHVAAHTSPETPLNLARPAWLNPYAASPSRSNTAAYPSCARPIQMTIGDPKTSFDSDHLPGAAFSIGTGMGNNSVPALGSLNVSTEADAIWLSEFSGATKKFFIGEAPGNADGNPSAKTVTSFKNIRGHSPDATYSQGSFYGASVARYGKYTGLTNPAIASTTLRVDQVSIALDSHIPKIQIPMANGKIISIVLTTKNIAGFGLSNAKGAYQGTGAITAFFIDTMANTNASNINAGINSGNPYYKFRVSFSDVDQGSDNESDAKVTYEIKVNAPTATATALTIGMEYFNSSTSVEMHEGYVIGGTTADGLYLDVGGGQAFGTPPPVAGVGYYLDTMPGRPPGSAMTDAKVVSGVSKTPTGPGYIDILNRLSLSTLAAPRTFTVGTSGNGEFIPHDMLWYAAKYGSAVRDSTGAFNFKLKPNGDPENYYLVNNPSTLAAQMGDAFQKAASLAVATASAVATNGTKVSGGALVYQAGFDSEKWGGELRSFKVLTDGSIDNTPAWRASDMLPAAAARTIVLGRGGSSTKIISPTSYSSLTSGTEQVNFKNDNTLAFLLGIRTKEKGNGGTLRDRTSGFSDSGNSKPTIGDIVNSDPLYIGKADFGYIDTSYDTFKASSDPKLVGVGSNDGSYRLVDALTGTEKLAFIPQSVTTGLSKLADPSYTHQYYVDGPAATGHVKFGSPVAWHSIMVANLGAGGKAVFALDASATDFANKGVLWEFAGSPTGDGSYLGNVMNKPIIGQLNDNDKAVVMVGNGINSVNNKASLIILNASTGLVDRTCTPTDVANSAGNGMSSIASVSLGAGKIDLVYAADYKGNIWRIDPTQSSSSCSSGAVKVFSAKNSSGTIQPITGELTVIKAPSPKAGYLILFGTGKYSGSTDPADASVQTLYGVWDDGSSATWGLVRANLLAYPIINYTASNLTRSVTAKGAVNSGKAWFEAGTYKGWMIDLSCIGCNSGERFVDKPTLTVSGTTTIAYFLTTVPGTDVCKVGGCGWVTGIDPNSGAYTKVYDTVDADSAKICGITPRGLFISSSSTGDEYVSITDNYTQGDPQEISPVFVPAGGKTCGDDNSCTDIKQARQYRAPTSAPSAVRRQVWRQIQ